jgi:diadenosine tetraphosphatase ApaH/serine/threonine PP2A family protein phosphatase
MNSIYHALVVLFTARLNQSYKVQRLPDPMLVSSVISNATALLREEPSLLSLPGDFVIVGDIHGNVDDLLRIFGREGYPPSTAYLFLGDYVDRGSNSIEVLLFLYIFKILFPHRIFLLRGNHECESITTAYGFKRECIQYLSDQLYREFLDSFQHLPYAAVLNSRIFCVHGGISPLLQTLQNLTDIPKPSEASASRLARDILWSEPVRMAEGFEHGDRGSGFLFNDEALDMFLNGNNLTIMLRSHEPRREGFDRSLNNCITIFSCTDYEGRGNSGAVAVLGDNGSYEIHTFRPVAKNSRKKPRVIVPVWLLGEIGVTREEIAESEDLLNLFLRAAARVEVESK